MLRALEGVSAVYALYSTQSDSTRGNNTVGCGDQRWYNTHTHTHTPRPRLGTRAGAPGTGRSTRVSAEHRPTPESQTPVLTMR